MSDYEYAISCPDGDIWPDQPAALSEAQRWLRTADGDCGCEDTPPLDLADGVRCGDCVPPSWSEPPIDRPSRLPWWSTGHDLTWPAVLLAFLLGTAVLVGAVVAGQKAMCAVHDDRISYCDGYGQQP